MLCRLLFWSTGSPTRPRQPPHRSTKPSNDANESIGTMALPSCSRAFIGRWDIACQLEMASEDEALARNPRAPERYPTFGVFATVCAEAEKRCTSPGDEFL